jgi:lipopolysaccharide transport system ATP-binding protein
MSELAICGEGLSKRYRIGTRERYRTLRDTLTNAFTARFRRRDREAADEAENAFWALKDVSFQVKHGEVIGIIGHNGAGKSTLLKILSRITEPTEGQVRIHGRVSSLLEVGTGFHPELTGRDNIYLNGAILGMKKAEIRGKFDEIVAFAEVEKFIDTPVKHYSSGMYVRLAFAVAAHLNTEILIVDEVLSVGDHEFQRRCLGRMGELSGQGRTCLFVSHNVGAIGRLCHEALLLDRGEIQLKGPAQEVIAQYQRRTDLHTEWARRSSTVSDQVALLRISILGLRGPRAVFAADERIQIEIEYAIANSLSACAICMRLYNAEGVVVLTTADSDERDVSARPRLPGRYTSTVTLPAPFLPPGSYSVLIAAHMPQRVVYDCVDQQVGFEISSVGSLTSLDGRSGLVAPLLEWSEMQVRAANGPEMGHNVKLSATTPRR